MNRSLLAPAELAAVEQRWLAARYASVMALYRVIFTLAGALTFGLIAVAIYARASDVDADFLVYPLSVLVLGVVANVFAISAFLLAGRPPSLAAVRRVFVFATLERLTWQFLGVVTCLTPLVILRSDLSGLAGATIVLIKSSFGLGALALLFLMYRRCDRDFPINRKLASASPGGFPLGGFSRQHPTLIPALRAIFGHRVSPLLLPAPADLAGWLNLAVGPLVPSAQSRIRPEIEAHFAEAVQFYLARGEPAASAQVAALADLGDAHAAAARFKRAYLTVAEVQLVQVRSNAACLASKGAFYGELASMAIWIAFSIGITVAWAYDPSVDGRAPLFSLAILFFVIVSALLVIVANLLARRPPTPSNLRRILALGTAVYLALDIPYLMNGVMLVHLGFPPAISFVVYIAAGGMFIGGILGPLVHCREDFRLRRKLAAASADDFPTSPAA